jgi:hypothetical protein
MAIFLSFLPRGAVWGSWKNVPKYAHFFLDKKNCLYYFGRKFVKLREGAMEKNKYLAISALGFFLTGCAGMTKNQAALVGAGPVEPQEPAPER